MDITCCSKCGSTTNKFYPSIKTRCKECVNNYNKNYRINNKDITKKISRRNDITRKNNPERIKYRNNYNKNYYKINKQRLLKTNSKWESNARKTNLVFRFKKNLKSLIRSWYKRNFIVKGNKTFDLLGYSSNDLFIHLNFYLDKNCSVCKCVVLTLNNSVIDHIIPLCAGTTEEEVIKLNQLNNLRLICGKCNSNKIKNDLTFIRRNV